MALNSSGPISLGGATQGQSVNLELGAGASSTISFNDTNVRTLTGTSSLSTLIMPTNFYGASLGTNLSYVLIGGGGGGQSAVVSVAGGGGGGAGGYTTGTFTGPVDSTITVTIGNGGAAGAQGGNTAFSGTGVTTITAVGGGYGGSGNGGSGGGAGGATVTTGGTATAGQGYAGGSTVGGGAGAGGGGAAAAGGNSDGYAGGNGGAGAATSISGSSVYYGGGGGGGAGVVPYNLSNSLRFRSSASAYLNRTMTTPTNNKLWTWSAWIKRGSIGVSYAPVFAAGANGSSYAAIWFHNDYLEIISYNSGNQYYLVTSQVFRDPSSWYHIMYTVDTTQATSSNRVKLYVNGVQVTAFSTATYPSQNYNDFINSATTHYLGQFTPAGVGYFDGYLAEVNFIDGQALTPTSFGYTNGVTGVWQPARYTGTYGLNGFYLPFTSVSSTYAGTFNGSSQYLTTTATGFNPSTGTWTIEGWAYCNSSGNNDTFINGQASGTDRFYFNSVGTTLYVGDGTINNLTISSAKIVGSWFHWAVVKNGSTYTLYLNGSSAGSSTTQLSSNTITTWQLSARPAQSSYLNGFATNIRVNTTTAVYTANFTPPTAPLTAISGTQLLTLQNATIVDNSTNAYAITNTGSVTTSIAYPFSTSSLGVDSSGNNNNWTPNNFSLTLGSTFDLMTDVPTLTGTTASNFCVWNSVAQSTVVNGSVTRSNANLTSTDDGTTYGLSSFGTIAVTTGKWYWEVTLTSAGSTYANIGVVDLNNPIGAGVGTGLVYAQNGTKNSGAGVFASGGGGASYGASYTAGDIIGVALDLTAGTITFYKNGVSQGVAYTGISGNYTPGVGDGQNATSYTFNLNCGQRPFAYTAPSGHLQLNTYNLPDPTILAGNKYMDATLWTGNSTGSTTQTITNAGGMKPDFLWGKSRNAAYNNVLIDSVRGTSKILYSDLTNAEATNANALSSFNANGFTVGTDAGGLNDNGKTFVGWQWQAGQGTTSTNTSGSITSTTSVNATSGFSIVSFTATGSNATVGHGLSATPQLVILKDRSTINRWLTYHQALGGTQALYVELANAATTSSTFWNNTAPTSTTVSIGTWSYAGSQIMYCWTPIAGFSQFGSYTGNGSTDGPFVNLGFRPKYVMIKMSSATGDWYVYDSVRNTYNATTQGLLPNSAATETTYTGWGDLLSNGFKIRRTDAAWNTSGGTYIYAAFAENPFKCALAR